MLRRLTFSDTRRLRLPPALHVELVRLTNPPPPPRDPVGAVLALPDRPVDELLRLEANVDRRRFGLQALTLSSRHRVVLRDRGQRLRLARLPLRRGSEVPHARMVQTHHGITVLHLEPPRRGH